MPRLLATVLIVLPAVAAGAQDWAKARLDQSPRHLEWVTVTRDDRKIESSIAYPEVSEEVPAVVVVHEIFGLTDWVRSVTDQLAEAGYIAIAPDLLSGMGPGGGGTASLGGNDAVRTAIRNLPQEQVTADLAAVVEYVLALPACNGKVVVAGFCWGGTQAFDFATRNRDIDAAFVFYGSGPDDPAAITRIAAPVYGFYGENDARINATIDATAQRMQDAGKTYESIIYQGAGHGFMRAGEAPDASDANKQASEDAWKRWKELLGLI